MLAKKGLMTAPAAVAQYVEDVFSTYLYTGNGSTQTITNGIDLSGEGGLVWTKRRNDISNNRLYDTERGALYALISDDTGAQASVANSLTAFNADGFSLGSSSASNVSTGTYASWTFRKAEKFFDVVTYTGNGTAGRTISHNLGSTPGCIIIKRTSDDSGWAVYHRSLNVSNNESFQLNSSIAAFTTEQYWNYTAPTSTEITLGNNATVNGNGSSYVAYIFAHDAGGFGEAGDQSVIKCGSYTGNGSTTGPTIDLGWEPQWVLIKNKSATARWTITDNMRGFTVADSGQQILQPHVTSAEIDVMYIQPTSTGFKVVDVDADVNTNGNTYIYVAIRRGPMKTPEAGTEVFSPTYDSSNLATNEVVTTNFPVDLVINARTGAEHRWFYDRLRGQAKSLKSSDTTAEGSTSGFSFDSNSSITSLADWGSTRVLSFKRAPGFFDVVATSVFNTGTDVNHNLGVTPELVIAKARNNSGGNWMGAFKDGTSIKNISLNATTAAYNPSLTWSDYFTSTTFNPTGVKNAAGGGVYGTSSPTVIYLFASLAGVSKVGTVTVASSAINVDCGFTSSARFVLLKRTSDASGWIVFDSARGIVAGDDPYLYLNSTAAENSDGAADIIDTYSSGFTLPAGGLSGITGEGTYLYLAIA